MVVGEVQWGERGGLKERERVAAVVSQWWWWSRGGSSARCWLWSRTTNERGEREREGGLEGKGERQNTSKVDALFGRDLPKEAK